jgi:hypothetical protein
MTKSELLTSAFLFGKKLGHLTREFVDALLSELKMMIIFLSALWAGWGWLIGRSVERGLAQSESLPAITACIFGMVGTLVALTAIVIRTYFLNTKQ